MEKTEKKSYSSSSKKVRRHVSPSTIIEPRVNAIERPENVRSMKPFDCEG